MIKIEKMREAYSVYINEFGAGPNLKKALDDLKGKIEEELKTIGDQLRKDA